MPARIDIDRDMIAEFCRRHRVKRLSLFGSVLREDFGPESDVDMLVEFEPNARVSLFDIGGMIHELSEKLHRPVDLRTPRELSRYFRQEVVEHAEPIYAAE